jgi:hypothetical protein
VSLSLCIFPALAGQVALDIFIFLTLSRKVGTCPAQAGKPLSFLFICFICGNLRFNPRYLRAIGFIGLLI